MATTTVKAPILSDNIETKNILQRPQTTDIAAMSHNPPIVLNAVPTRDFKSLYVSEVYERFSDIFCVILISLLNYTCSYTILEAQYFCILP